MSFVVPADQLDIQKVSHYPIILFCITKFGSQFLSKKLLFTSPLFWISNFILTIMSCIFGQTRIVPKSTNTIHYLECIEKYQPEFTAFSPSSLLFLVDHPDFDKFNLKSLKLIFSKWKNVHILQGYGMTEFGGGITSPNFGNATSSVGKVLPNTSIKIVDPSSGKILGPNEIGECRVKADRVMIGYYNNEKATKESFDDDGWFKTGDLMYYDDNKLLYVVGRIKETVKYQNYQISLAEIENFIISLPGVKDAAIVPIPPMDQIII
ncbi:2-succinylbenzoate--CoA ligase, putative [Pediculus humanus corporis]|uniref:2-succinylbenzoate--CoA ligase, putative n=1 Tax=Pediculus humanus subsp. corporis TaxID=121224 RepID=E0VJU2_PEDHC|nr:2-succinylbenzoate--CoA ligase, putative [Pediculus humanus corporis]EEB13648.1 2-succinylbenzoate--CoA ligase, putative [Pediculus humanus corporis]